MDAQESKQQRLDALCEKLRTMTREEFSAMVKGFKGGARDIPAQLDASPRRPAQLEAGKLLDESRKTG